MPWRRERFAHVDLSFEVEKVLGKQRHRTGRNGNSYTPRQTVLMERFIRSTFEGKFGRRFALHDGPVEITVFSTRELAKSNPKYWAGRSDLGKPDEDNVLKIAQDALNGLAYVDDSQVVDGREVKLPRVAHGSGNTIRIVFDYFKETYQRCNR